jgi:6-phosphogluconolactonase (cycloisomerase 2 family)
MKRTLREIILANIINNLSWWGIDTSKYELEHFEISEGSGRVTFVHKENNKKLPYAERRLQITSFYFDENGKLVQVENPILT